MYVLIIFLSFLSSSVAGFFGRFLGSKSTTITGGSLIFLAFLLLGLSLLFRLYYLCLKKKYGSKVVLFLYISILFFISLFCFFFSFTTLLTF